MILDVYIHHVSVLMDCKQVSTQEAERTQNASACSIIRGHLPWANLSRAARGSPTPQLSQHTSTVNTRTPFSSLYSLLLAPSSFLFYLTISSLSRQQVGNKLRHWQDTRAGWMQLSRRQSSSNPLLIKVLVFFTLVPPNSHTHSRLPVTVEGYISVLALRVRSVFPPLHHRSPSQRTPPLSHDTVAFPTVVLTT